MNQNMYNQPNPQWQQCNVMCGGKRPEFSPLNWLWIFLFFFLGLFIIMMKKKNVAMAQAQYDQCMANCMARNGNHNQGQGNYWQQPGQPAPTQHTTTNQQPSQMTSAKTYEEQNKK